MRGKRKAVRSCMTCAKDEEAGKVLLTKGLREVMCQMKGDTLCEDVKRPDVWKERTGTRRPYPLCIKAIGWGTGKAVRGRIPSV